LLVVPESAGDHWPKAVKLESEMSTGAKEICLKIDMNSLRLISRRG
jgi:hypothetical protein